MAKPKPEPDPVDDDAAEPVEMVSGEFYGVTFKWPKDRDEWDTEAFIALSRGDHLLSIQLVIGRDQWRKLRLIGKSRRITKEFAAMLREVSDRECIN